MKRRTQAFVAFVLSVVLVALGIAYGMRATLRHTMLRGIPEMAAREMQRASFLAAEAPRWVYSGTLEGQSSNPEWISVAFPEAGSPRIALTIVMGGGEGAVNLLGLVQDDGSFTAGLTNRSIGFPHFESVAGRVAGPALIEGRPALWLEAEPRSATSRSQPQRLWSGILLAEGFEH